MKRNIPCSENAQRWYFMNALNKYKNAKNIYEKNKQGKIVNYYLNGNLNNVKFF
jgi:hypothetical protein